MAGIAMITIEASIVAIVMLSVVLTAPPTCSCRSAAALWGPAAAAGRGDRPVLPLSACVVGSCSGVPAQPISVRFPSIAANSC